MHHIKALKSTAQMDATERGWHAGKRSWMERVEYLVPFILGMILLAGILGYAGLWSYQQGLWQVECPFGFKPLVRTS